MTQNVKASTINDLIRSITVTLIDRPAYWILGILYEIFFNVATAELFTNATIKDFFSRVQLIIGVFMVFKLAVTILQGIVNPDKMTDKNNGFSSLITRVIFALVMLTIIVPINIPNAKTEYEIELNNNGLLFGTLYSLQNRLLTTNTLGRLILGTTDNATTDSTDDDSLSGADKQAKKLTEASNVFTSSILKGFLRINVVPESERIKLSKATRDKLDEGKECETLNECRMCPDIDDDTLKIYTKLNADPGELLDLVNASCTSAADSKWFGEYLYNKVVGLWDRIKGDDRYVFAYIPILGGLTAFIFAFILLGFTVDIAVRAVKLAVLRLIAPIPIISYIQPESAKKGAFAAWVKTLTSTYLDLFLRLAIVYFIIFLIQDMIANGVVITVGTGPVGVLSTIMLWLGLFFFARQAPKFIKDVLGIQGNGMQNIGLSGLLGGTAMLAGGGGIKGAALGMMNGAEGSIQATNQGKAMALGQTWSQNRDTMAKIRTGDKDAKGGLIGSTLDRLNYQTRENQARKLGMGVNDVADAKYMKDQYDNMAQQTAKELDAAKIAYQRGDITADAYQQAYEKNAEYQALAGKAGKRYEKMDKDRANFGVGPRISDTRTKKYQRRQQINNTFGTSFKTEDDSGTYRSPHKTVGEDVPVNNLSQHAPDLGTQDNVLKGNIQSHKKDVNNFSGTADDSSVGSSGHGVGPV